MPDRDIEQETKAFVEALDAALVDSKAHFNSSHVPPGVIPQWVASGHSPILLARQLIAKPPIAPPVAASPSRYVTTCSQCGCQDFEYIQVQERATHPIWAILLLFLCCFPLAIIFAIGSVGQVTKNKLKCKNCGFVRPG